MDHIPLINSEKIILKKTNYIPIILLVLIFFMQIFCFVYMIILGKIAQDINLFNYNKTETADYIDKFKRIIDNVCANMIKC